MVFGGTPSARHMLRDSCSAEKERCRRLPATAHLEFGTKLAAAQLVLARCFSPTS
jgi:hypothetical protein